MKKVMWLALLSCAVLFTLVSGLAGALMKWEVVKSPVEVDLRAVYFGDDSNIFAAGDKGTVIKSSDAGKTWKEQKSGSQATLRGVHFTDAKHGWACGDGDPAAPGVGGGHIITGRPMTSGSCLVTSDGGKKWDCTWVPTNFNLRSIWMASDKIGQICNHGGGNHPDGDCITTTDGGRNWTLENLKGTRVCGRALNDCCWVSEKKAWAVGSIGMSLGGRNPIPRNPKVRILHSADGGKSWKLQEAQDIGEKNELRSVWFVNSKFGCAVGDAGCIFVTSNAGKKWKKVKSGTDKALYAVCFTDKKNGWAVGEAGTILATTDGGKTWVKMESPAKEALYGLHFNKKGKVGIAVGTGGKIIRLAK